MQKDNPPQWAAELVTQVCTSHGKRKPRLVWKRASYRIWRGGQLVRKPSRHSSGSYSGGYHRILVRQGQDPIDARLVLLHELAHAMVPRKQKAAAYSNYKYSVSRGHDKRFWTKAWRLYAKYGIPIEYAKKREWPYMVKAKAAYYEVKPYKETAS